MTDRAPNSSPPVVASPAADEPSFRFEESAAGRVIVSRPLGLYADHLFTTRQLQFREPTLDCDYDRLADAFSSRGAVVRVRQVHGRAVLLMRPGQDVADISDADAIVSTDPDRVISVRVADCVPILIADRQGRAVAAIHAGWRGTAAGVVDETMDVLAGLGVSAADLVAAVGPSIGPCCYQVDETVRHAFAPVERSLGFAADGPGHWRLDLAAVNRGRLLDRGVPPDAVSLSGECTSHGVEHWHSFRRDGAIAGRMAAAIRLR